MDIKFTFSNSTGMCKAFRDALDDIGYKNTGTGNVVSFTFGNPKTEQPALKSVMRSVTNANNTNLNTAYHNVKNYLGISNNDPNNFEEAIIQNATQVVQENFEQLMDAVSNLTKTRLF